jgi:sRNA-binding regulator protein Hfq
VPTDDKQRGPKNRPNQNEHGRSAVSNRSSEPRFNAAQDLALQKWAAAGYELTVHLRNNARVRGVLVGWNQYSLMLKAERGIVERVQKAAILSIVPPR